MNSVDQNLSSSVASAVEVRRLLEENARLRSLLIAHTRACTRLSHVVRWFSCRFGARMLGV